MHKHITVRTLSKLIEDEIRRLNTRSWLDNKTSRDTWKGLMRTSGIKFVLGPTFMDLEKFNQSFTNIGPEFPALLQPSDMSTAD